MGGGRVENQWGVKGEDDVGIGRLGGEVRGRRGERRQEGTEGQSRRGREEWRGRESGRRSVDVREERRWMGGEVEGKERGRREEKNTSGRSEGKEVFEKEGEGGKGGGREEWGGR